MTDYLLDTNLLSKIFYGDAEVKDFVDNLNTGIDTIVYIECIQGSIGKKDRDRIKISLSQLKYYPINSEIALSAIELIDKHSAAHGLFLADAMIGATALHYDLVLVTFNGKHFRSIKELSVTEPN